MTKIKSDKKIITAQEAISSNKNENIVIDVTKISKMKLVNILKEKVGIKKLSYNSRKGTKDIVVAKINQVGAQKVLIINDLKKPQTIQRSNITAIEMTMAVAKKLNIA